jgi:hypothetical protein
MRRLPLPTIAGDLPVAVVSIEVQVRADAPDQITGDVGDLRIGSQILGAAGQRIVERRLLLA